MRRMGLAALCGAVGAYVALAAGPIAAGLVLLAFVLGLRAFHGRLREAGAVMLGVGIAGALVTGRVLWLAAKCDYQPCTSSLTAPTFAASLVLGAVGIGVITYGWGPARSSG